MEAIDPETVQDMKIEIQELRHAVRSLCSVVEDLADNPIAHIYNKMPSPGNRARTIVTLLDEQ